MRKLILGVGGVVALAACSSSSGPSSSGTSSSSSSGATSTSSSSTSSSSTSTSTSSSGSTSSSSSSGAGGGGTGGEGIGGGVTLGTAITAPAGTWTWVPFADAHCANGESTGIGINIAPASAADGGASPDRVIIYFEGGGACWSDLTCYTAMTAANFTSGYTEANFTADAASTGGLAQSGGFFDRSDPTNPFQSYSYVYIPYCTGDIYAGDNVVTYPHSPAGGTHFVGHRNVEAFLSRIVPTFKNAERAYMSGSSAGGFGAAFNWWLAQQYFGSVRVDLIDDSGTPMPPAIEATGLGETVLRTAWNLDGTFPSGCTECQTELDGILTYSLGQFGSHRATLLSYVQDTVLPGFFGITTAQFSSGLQTELTKAASDANFQYFTNPGAGHVLFFSPTLQSGAGVTLKSFLTKMVTDDPTWASTM